MGNRNGVIKSTHEEQCDREMLMRLKEFFNKIHDKGVLEYCIEQNVSENNFLVHGEERQQLQCLVCCSGRSNLVHSARMPLKRTCVEKFGHETLLVTAIKMNDVKSVEFLLSSEAIHGNTSFIDGNGPMHLAVEHLNVRVVELLVDADVDVNAMDINLNTPMDIVFKAIESYHDQDDDVMQRGCSIVEILIKAGANVNHLNGDGVNPLYQSILLGFSDITPILLRAGARISAVSRNSEDILNFLVCNNQHDIARSFIEESDVDINAISVNGNNALNYAVFQQDFNMAQMLVSKGILADFDTSKQRCPLCTTIRLKNRQLFDFLLAELSVRHHLRELDKPHSFTCLQVAAKYKEKYMLMELLDAGANVNALSEDNVNAIYYAAHKSPEDDPEDYNEILKTLVSRGADVNETTTKDGDSAFSYVLSQAREDTVRLFLERNVDMSKITFDPNPLFYSLMNEDGGVFNLIAKSGQIDVHAKNQHGRNILHYAYGKKDITQGLEYLMAEGVDVNCKCEFGITPLYNAIHGGTHELIRLLLLRGADVNDGRSHLSKVQRRTDFEGKNDVVHVVIKFLAIGELQGKAIHEHDYQAIRNDVQLRIAHIVCKSELEYMQQCFIRDCISLFDVLVDAKAYARNRYVIEALTDEDILEDFGIYRDVLVKRFGMARMRYDLMEQAMDGLRLVLKWEALSYPIIFENILSHLGSKDLRNLISLGRDFSL